MLKRILIWGLALLCLSGCSASTAPDTTSAQSVELYEMYLTDLLEQTEFQTSTETLSVSWEMSKLPDGTYRYYLILDNPTLALYDLQALAVVDSDPNLDTNTMMPSVGVFDGPYNLVPHQVNKSEGYVKGVILNGTTTQPELTIHLLLQWNGETVQEQTREYLTLDLRYEE